MEFRKGDIVERLQWGCMVTVGKHYPVVGTDNIGDPYIINDNGDRDVYYSRNFKLVKRANMKDKNCITLNGVDITLTDEQVKQIEGVVKQEEIIRVPDCIDICDHIGGLRLHISPFRKIEVYDGLYYIDMSVHQDKVAIKLVKTTFGELREGDIFVHNAYDMDLQGAYRVKVNCDYSICSHKDEILTMSWKNKEKVYKVTKID